MTPGAPRRWRLAVVVALSVAAMSGCAGQAVGGPAPQRTTVLTPAPGEQPWESLAPVGPDRVGPLLLSDPGGITGLTLKSLDSPYADDIASSVCGNNRGEGVYSSDDGQVRDWAGAGLTVEQFVGLFRVPDAAAAIAQVRGVLVCTSYQDRDGAHTAVHTIATPTLPNTDGRLLFCENLATALPYQCTALLSHRDELVRLQVQASTEAAALDAVHKLSTASAKLLGNG